MENFAGMTFLEVALKIKLGEVKNKKREGVDL
jgi:hypothetical protein